MNDDQLLRYSRHILLDELGIEGQQRLLAAHALVIGAGGLGSPVALYLATAGLGTITIVDGDTVDLTNLQRQIAHDLSRVGAPKASSAAQTMRSINPDVRIHALHERADAARLDALVAEADVVIDCSDNFATRHAVNAACVAHGKPLVSGAAIGFDGQLSVYDTRDAAKPCYACLFPPDAVFEEVRCATMGVFAPLVGIICRRPRWSGPRSRWHARPIARCARSGVAHPCLPQTLRLRTTDRESSDVAQPRGIPLNALSTPRRQPRDGICVSINSFI
jgi:molybdopterin/thiamine biosynthesis adenylyltransferase